MTAPTTKFETVWPEGVDEFVHVKDSGPVHWCGECRNGVAKTMEECIVLLERRNVRDPMSFGKIVGSQKFHEGVWDGYVNFMILHLLHGGLMRVPVRGGIVRPSRDQLQVFKFLEIVLSLSPSARLVGTWRDGTPVENGKIFFHIV